MPAHERAPSTWRGPFPRRRRGSPGAWSPRRRHYRSAILGPVQLRDRVTTALVRAPGPRLAEGIVTHLERTEIDLERARAQWAAYVATLEGFGWRIMSVDPADDCPDAVFVEDTAVMFDRLAVLTRPGAPSREPEVTGTATALGRLAGIETVGLASGRLDGGDVLKIGKRAYVGIGGRTDA